MPMALSRRPPWIRRLRPLTTLAALFTSLARSVGELGEEVRARRAIGYLRSLDDRQLRDLGVERDDIECFVRSRQHR
jgi:uncharacterized protein YjiS (DUF1127 family)